MHNVRIVYVELDLQESDDVRLQLNRVLKPALTNTCSDSHDNDTICVGPHAFPHLESTTTRDAYCSNAGVAVKGRGRCPSDWAIESVVVPSDLTVQPGDGDSDLTVEPGDGDELVDIPLSFERLQAGSVLIRVFLKGS